MESTPLQQTPQPQFRGEIVRKIYRVWFFRRFLPAVIIELTVFSIFLYFLTRAIFVQRIVENALRIFFTNPAEIIAFVLFAFLYAHIAVKILSFTVLILVSYLVYKLLQALIRFILVKENYFAKVKNHER